MSDMKKVKLLQEMKKVMEKRNRLMKERVESQPGYGVAKLLEGELERAELILAAKDLVNRIQDMTEKVAKMTVEDVMPLVDNMKGEFSPEQSQQFDESASSALTAALEGLKAAREEINNHVLRMEGKLSDEDVATLDTTDMASDDGLGGAPADDGLGDMGGEEMGGLGDEEGDLFGGAEAAAGPEEEPLGRARKEGFRNPAKVLESKKKS